MRGKQFAAGEQDVFVPSVHAKRCRASISVTSGCSSGGFVDDSALLMHTLRLY